MARELRTTVTNIGPKGAALRRWGARYIIAPPTLLLAILTVKVGLNPALLHYPLAAIVVVELEAACRFCVLKGAAAKCTRPNISRATAMAMVTAGYLIGLIPVLMLTRPLGCTLDPQAYLPIVGPVVYTKWFC